MSDTTTPRYGAAILPWQSYREAQSFTTAMSEPDSAQKCAGAPGREVEFLFYKPLNLTAYTLHYGRWVEGPNGLSAWVQLGTVAEASAGSAAKMVHVPKFTSHGDKVGVYVDGLTGTPATTFKFWLRVVG